MYKSKKLLALMLAFMLVFSLAACGGGGGEEEAVDPITPTGYDAFSDVVDIDFSKEVIQSISEFGDDPDTGNRSAGSPAEKETSEYIKSTMEEIGLQNVTVDNTNVDGWTYKGANITFTNDKNEEQKIILGGYATTLQAENEDVEVVFLNKGTEADYEGVDVNGKLVLIDIDQDNEWWINYPTYQAKLKGAKAVLAMSKMATENEDRIGSQDIFGPADAPAFGISQKDSEALQAAIKASGGDSITVKLNADSTVTPDSQSQNVWGEIPGKSDEVIMFIAHYDGYYHSYYDDAFGVGTILGLAKAFIDSGIEPEKTLRFVTHGAEEWGKSNSDADWAVGSYEQIVNIHPEWGESTFGLINIDSGYTLESAKTFGLSLPTEAEAVAGSVIENFGTVEDVAIDTEQGLPSVGREDFIYNAMGLLTFSNSGNEGDEEYFAGLYHSNMDALEVGGFNDDLYTQMNKFYGYLTLSLDEMALKPFNFEKRFELFEETLNTDMAANEDAVANLAEAKEAAASVDAKINEINDAYAAALADEDADTAASIKEAAVEQNKQLYALYKQTQDDFLRLSWWSEYQFGHEGLQYNIETLQASVDLLNEGDAQAAIDEGLSAIENNFYATAFDQETCDFFVDRMFPQIEGTWAEGRIFSDACDASKEVKSLMAKIEEGNTDYSAEIASIEALIKAQQTQLDEEVAREATALTAFATKATEILSGW